MHGQPGGAYRRMYDAITLSSPTAFLGLPHLRLRSRRSYLSVGEYQEYLDRYAHALDIQPERAIVKEMAAADDGLRVALAGHRDPSHYRAVVVATGMCEHPLMPQIAGLSKDNRGASPVRLMHSHEWRGPGEHRGKRMLIVGRGMRGVEIAEECAKAGQRVTISARGAGVAFSTRWAGIDTRRVWFPFTRYLSQLPLGRRLHCDKPITFRPIDYGYSNYRRAGLVEERGEVAAFEGNVALFKSGSRTEFDVVVMATGYRVSMPFLPENVATSSHGFPITRQGESVTWPGLFFLGSPCASGVYSQFIHGIAQDARRLARTITARLAA
jgi:putative flavoprotein involved in K+ transport